DRIGVVLKDATGILASLFKNHPSEKIVVKIDCEGAEYEILEKLYLNGLLSRVDVLMIEWHLKGPQSICDLLIKSNFGIVSLLPYNKVAGMIYAFNKSNS